MDKIEIEPIGIIHTSLKQAGGAPIQPSFAKDTSGVVELEEKYAEGLKDLDGFDRIWLIFNCNRCSGYKLTVTPYMDTQPRGLFSTRAPARPNAIGMSAVKLDRIEGCKLYISELDILDGTPLLDIKPYTPKFDHLETERCGWMGQVGEQKGVADERFHK